MKPADVMRLTFSIEGPDISLSKQRKAFKQIGRYVRSLWFLQSTRYAPYGVASIRLLVHETRAMLQG